MTVRSDADVGGNLSAAGARVTFDGTVGGDADIAAATMRVNATIGGNLTAAGARLTIDGSVDGKSEIIGARMDLRATFNGPIEVIGEGTDASGRAILAGEFLNGGTICATEIEIRDRAQQPGLARAGGARDRHALTRLDRE